MVERRKRLPFTCWVIKKMICRLRDFRKLLFEFGTVVEIFFISLYGLQQFLLLYYTQKAGNIQEVGFIVSVFAIVILSTFAIHKLVIISKFKIVSAALNELYREYDILEERFYHRHNKKGYPVQQRKI